MLIHTSTITLPDGRTLAYSEYGDPNGRPLIWLHGNPGSRREPELLDPALLQRLQVRAIVPDRPGIGRSTFKPQRRLIDWPTDLAALAAALRLERFALMSLSAGSPSLLACAWAMPHRITRAAIVSGLAPLEVLDKAALRAPGPRYFALARRSYWLARGMVWLMSQGLQNPDKMIAQVMRGLPPADQTVLAEPRLRQAFLIFFREALRQGTRGPAWDAVISSRPWGVDLEAIPLPIDLWHGEEDRNAPPDMGRYLAGKLRHSRFHLHPNEGHFSLAARHMPVILQTLMAG